MFLQQLVNGLSIGFTYALVAVGFTLVYGVLELVNFAHGSFYLLGAYVGITLLGFITNDIYLVIILSILFSGILGMLMDVSILKPIRKTDMGISALIATLGISNIINNLIIVIYGSETKSFPDIFSRNRFDLGKIIIKWNQVGIAVVSIVVMGVLSICIYKTKMGRGMRAISQNPKAALLMGVPVSRIISLTFFFGTACASLSGCMVASYYRAIDTSMYLAICLKTFAAVVLGGVGSIYGAMIAGVLIGVLETLATAYLSSNYRDAVAFVILIVVLIFCPNGLFGHKKAVKV